jgi:tRNA(His) 5'-end guanylyltransferase
MKDDLGSRMKEFYEARSQTYLLRRTPVIIRVDGKAFHTFCRRFEKPYDKVLNGCLNKTLKYLCGNIQCVKMGQRHSDEMSLLLTDFDTLTTEPYFEYNVQKICSVVASMTATEFCKQVLIGGEWQYKLSANFDKVAKRVWHSLFDNERLSYDENWPVFDCRCFNIPEKEVSNYFWWRLLDCKRSSINMMAQSLFSHAQLQNKTCNEMQEMMFQEKGINWDTIPQEQKSGFLCIRKNVEKPVEKGPDQGKVCLRSVWTLEPSPKQKSDLDKIVDSVMIPQNIPLQE